MEDIKLMCKVQGMFDTLEASHYPDKIIRQRKAFLALKRK